MRIIIIKRDLTRRVRDRIGSARLCGQSRERVTIYSMLVDDKVFATQDRFIPTIPPLQFRLATD